MVDRSSKALFFELSQMLKDYCTVSPIILSCTVAVAVRGSCVAQSYVAELSIRASCISSAPSGNSLALMYWSAASFRSFSPHVCHDACPQSRLKSRAVHLVESIVWT